MLSYKNISLFDEKMISTFSILVSFIPIIFFLGPAIPDIIISLSSIFYIYLIFKYKGFDNLKDKLFVIFLLFWIFALISTVNSDFKNYLGSTIVYIRFIFFLLFVKFVLSKNYFLQKNIFKVISISLIFASIDGLIQYHFGTDLIGRKLAEKGQFRLSGPFESDEHILGFYISSFGFIALGYILELKLPKILKNVIFIFTFILFFLIIFLSGERMAFLLFLFGIFILILLNLGNLKLIIIGIISIIFISALTYSYNEKSFGRIISIFDILGLNINQDINTKRFRDSHYGSHYLTAIEMFNEKKLLGHGVRSFRYECSDIKYDNIDSALNNLRCATHPHNFYLQILSENGIIGFSLFIFFLFFIIQDIYQRFFKNNYIFQGVVISIILFLWPLKSSFDIYNNRHSAFLYFSIVLTYIIFEKLKKLDIKKDF